MDEMGPESAKSFPGKEIVQSDATEKHHRDPRAKQEIDYGRRDEAGYIFGAFEPKTGKALTDEYESRSAKNWVHFLEQTEAWIPASVKKIYAIMDNLGAHKARDVLLFSLAHPRWEFVFQPVYAAYLNLIEPWWKNLRSLAFKGRRFETWSEMAAAINSATSYWNNHRHPFIWGRRRHRRPRRAPGIAGIPGVPTLSV
jgi:hypothetical protein